MKRRSFIATVLAVLGLTRFTRVEPELGPVDLTEYVSNPPYDYALDDDYFEWYLKNLPTPKNMIAPWFQVPEHFNYRCVLYPYQERK